ncbi:MAG: hypothetical protein HW375_9 [Anaerolineales bacterium]|nr:hypothetical protein [Anaerolineales bacterium]
MRQPVECVCRCRCGRTPDTDGDGMCLLCWQSWNAPLDIAEQKHQPIADRSYLGTFGLTGIWTPWLMNVAGHLLAARAAEFGGAAPVPKCPGMVFGFRCREPMAYRADGWKCYRHTPPVVVKFGDGLSRVPRGSRLPVEMAK